MTTIWPPCSRSTAAQCPYFRELNFFERYFRAKFNLDYSKAREKFTIFYTTYACADDFDPFVKTAAARYAVKTDPFFIGYWSDNELPFPMGAKQLLQQHLALPAGEIPQQVAEAWLKTNGLSAKTDYSEETNMQFKRYIVETYHRRCRDAIKSADPRSSVLRFSHQ